MGEKLADKLFIFGLSSKFYRTAYKQYFRIILKLFGLFLKHFLVLLGINFKKIGEWCIKGLTISKS